MFEINKYAKWYWQLVNKASHLERNKDEAYYEKHHIVPKSLGGDNSMCNIVLLTPKEHFICHLLLPKICISSDDKRRMVYALMRLSGGRNGKSIKYNSRNYQTFKNMYIPLISKENCYMYGKPKSLEMRARLSVSRKKSGVAKGENNPNFGRCRTETVKARISHHAKKRYKLDPTKWIERNPRSRKLTDGKVVYLSISDARRKRKTIYNQIIRDIESGILRYIEI
jgi:hypothetical protein